MDLGEHMTIATQEEMDTLISVMSRLYTFTRFTYGPTFIPGEHLQEMCEALEPGMYQPGRRLIINLPPRHSKTTIASIHYPTWRIFQNPNMHILIITYGDDLSERIGTRIRSLIAEFGPIFNIYLSSHTASKTKLQFQDSAGNPYKGSIEILGYKGAITGKDADLVIIDDLIKGPEDALSPRQNEKIVDFYKSTIFTRLFSDSEVIVVSTRWSKTDLAGYLLSKSSETWKTHIKPAIDPDTGEALWSARFSKDRLLEIEDELGPFWWAALYLQDPEDVTGDVFEGQFEYVLEADPDTFDRLVLYIDRAATEPSDKNDPDYTAMMLMVRLKEPLFDEAGKYEYIVLYNTRFRKSPAGNEKKIKEVADKLKGIYGNIFEIVIELEPGSTSKDSFWHYKREVLKGFRTKDDRPSGSKHTRAIDVAAKVEQKHVRFLKNNPGNRSLFLEMRAFPHGNHDDQVDTLSGSFNKLRRKRASIGVA